MIYVLCIDVPSVMHLVPMIAHYPRCWPFVLRLEFDILHLFGFGYELVSPVRA